MGQRAAAGHSRAGLVSRSACAHVRCVPLLPHVHMCVCVYVCVRHSCAYERVPSCRSSNTKERCKPCHDRAPIPNGENIPVQTPAQTSRASGDSQPCTQTHTHTPLTYTQAGRHACACAQACLTSACAAAPAAWAGASAPAGGSSAAGPGRRRSRRGWPCGRWSTAWRVPWYAHRHA